MGVERTLQWFPLSDYQKRDSCSATLEVELESVEGRMGNGVSRLFGEFENDERSTFTR